MVDAINNTGFAVVGTPEMAVAQLERLQVQSGGFGTFLLMAHEWANREATLHSYELFARDVMPHFQSSMGSLIASRDWAAEHRPDFIGAAGGAVMQAIQDHNEEKAQKQASVGGTASH
jgi:limonene 1,2-monooxygenase